MEEKGEGLLADIIGLNKKIINQAKYRRDIKITFIMREKLNVSKLIRYLRR